MKIAVIGAGIIGVTTAYELARRGHDVEVFERHGAVAEGASFANAGVLAPGYVTPWAAQGMPGKVLRYLFQQHAPVRLGRPGWRDLAWMRRWLKACDPTQYKVNRERMQRLAFYSRACLHELTHQLQMDYDRRSGYTVLLRSAQDETLVQASLDFLREAGVPFQRLDRHGVLALEPALNVDTELHAGIHLPDDEVANCRQFAVQLRQHAEALGVLFHFKKSLSPLRPAAPTTLDGRHGAATFEAVVMCAGVQSADLLRPLGLRIPLTAVYGYSLTAPVREDMDAPRSALMDERYKVAISRLGNRVRVAGSAEIGGDPLRLRDASVQTLYKVLNDWFPGGAQLSQGVQIWKGARPMLPDGPPLLGASGVPGIWLNLGHGSSGWALSCGSARAVADLISGHDPGLDLNGYQLSERFPS